MKSLEIIDDHYCFVCGMENPDGLRLDWKIEECVTFAGFTPDRKYQASGKLIAHSTGKAVKIS
jgi:hypothetical protein